MVSGYTFGEYMFEVYESMNIYIDFNDYNDEEDGGLAKQFATAVHECWDRGTDVNTAASVMDMKFSESDEEEDEEDEDDSTPP